MSLEDTTVQVTNNIIIINNYIDKHRFHLLSERLNPEKLVLIFPLVTCPVQIEIHGWIFNEIEVKNPNWGFLPPSLSSIFPLLLPLPFCLSFSPSALPVPLLPFSLPFYLTHSPSASPSPSHSSLLPPSFPLSLCLLLSFISLSASAFHSPLISLPLPFCISLPSSASPSPSASPASPFPSPPLRLPFCLFLSPFAFLSPLLPLFSLFCLSLSPSFSASPLLFFFLPFFPFHSPSTPPPYFFHSLSEYINVLKLVGSRQRLLSMEGKRLLKRDNYTSLFEAKKYWEEHVESVTNKVVSFDTTLSETRKFINLVNLIYGLYK